MKEMVCIVCPVGCLLNIEGNGENLSVSGNKCSRGTVYALEEINAPKRVVTATCLIDGDNSDTASVRRVPVKTSSPCLREKIPALLQDIYKVKVSLPVKRGDIIIEGWKGEDFNVVATRTINAVYEA
jgi:CxxC motif-containing protein